MICTSIGPFEIVKELAVEGAVCVYKAVDTRSGRTVALRTLAPSGSEADSDLKGRVLARAKLASALDSPNIASTYGAGSADGLIFVATEYVDGVSFRALLAKQKKFSMWDLLDYTRQMQMALDHARRCGIVHLNLHPATIMIELDGTLKILNFGILGPDTAASPKPPEALRYFSPEQINGQPLDMRSNLYSWGAILYEAVTGARLFADQEGEDLRQAILQTAPAIADACREGSSGGACPAILKLLAKAPDDRFQSCADVVAELEKTTRPVIAPPAMCAVSVPGAVKNEVPASRLAEPAQNNGDPSGNHHDTVTESPAPPPLPKNGARPSAAADGHRPAPAPPNMVVIAETERVLAKKPLPVRPARKDARVLYLAAIAVVLVAIVLMARQLRGTPAPAPEPPVAAATGSSAGTDSTPSQATYSDPYAVAAPVPRPKPRRQAAPRVETPPPPVTGDLVVSSTPAGAQVRIDNDSRSSGVTPYTATALSPGPHTITIAKDGYTQQAHKVIVEARRRLSFDVTLAESEASVAVDSDPEGATMFVDGHNSGSTTPERISLAKGSHSIRLVKAGYFETTQSVQLAPGQTTRVKPSLIAMGDTDSIKVAGGKLKRIFGGASQNMASLQVRTLPKGARITINGREVEKPSPVELTLAPGNYQLAMSLEGYKPVRKMITVSATSKAIVEESLEPAGTSAMAK